jgi:hypothetical protein
MSQLFQISPDTALLVGRAVVMVAGFVVAAIAFMRWRRASERTTELFFEQNRTLLARLTALEEQIAANQTQLASARAEIASLAGRLEEEGEQRRIPAPATTAAPSYQIAIRLARSGAPREEIMASCGLSRQEAELVQRLHSPRETTVRAPGRTAKLAAAG